MTRQNAWVTQEIGQNVYPLAFRERAVVILAQTGDFEQFGKCTGMAFTVLAHIESSKMKTKDLYLADKCGQLPLSDLLFAIRQ